MIYSTELESGLRLEIENKGDLTYVSVSSGGASQQQSQRSGFETGPWVQKPSALLSPTSVTIELQTAAGPRYIVLSGGSLRAVPAPVSLAGTRVLKLTESPAPPFSPMTPMKPMAPMTPMDFPTPAAPGEMRLGDMTMKPGEMRMGNMHLSFNTPEPPTPPPAASPETSTIPKFCTQCGHPTASTDRFCGQCGHRLIA